jgi:hypothetical protein
LQKEVYQKNAPPELLTGGAFSQMGGTRVDRSFLKRFAWLSIGAALMTITL